MKIYCTGIKGSHGYAEHTCPACGQDFCFSCCGSTNVHEGGKYSPDFMTCPACGFDIYSEDDPSEYLIKARRRLEDRLRKDKAALRRALAAAQDGMTVANWRRLAFLEAGLHAPAPVDETEISVSWSPWQDGDRVKIKLPPISVKSDAGQVLASVLGEIQPGFGQLTVGETHCKLVHAPEIGDQQETFDLTFWVK
jgi:hypothetical protein